jgi:hypothetical protein
LPAPLLSEAAEAAAMARKAKKRPRFKRILARAWQRPEPGLSDEQFKEFYEREAWREAQEISRVQMARLKSILNHYGINPSHPNAWLLLAYHLARDYYPGFKILKSSVAEPSKQRRSGAALIAEIETVRAEFKLDVDGACDWLSQHGGAPWRGRDSATIRRRYYEARRVLKGPAFDQLMKAWKQVHPARARNERPVFERLLSYF